ncbi:MAG: YiiX/YebB-like N1pC/P60 family cysteine hydrolase [Nitrospinota bacterium]|nr:YiiX/YebB-like N1pC/P60 family cysteine hydrolase [Nitrospinota bacterium]
MEREVDMIHTYSINGVPLSTGDLICTTNGDETVIGGQIWRLIGKLVPGEVDHVAMYVGPNGRCVEAGAKLKAIAYSADSVWNSSAMAAARGVHDTFYGIVYPLNGSKYSGAEQEKIRISVANYCLAQVNAGKPYNLNFLDSEREDSFYCSQLVYKAYQKHGINLNTEKDVPQIPFTKSIIFPQEIWSGFPNKRS